MSGTDSAAGPGRTLIFAFVLGCAVFSERAVVTVSTGGAGALGLVPIAALLAAAAVVLRYGARQTLGFMAAPRFVFAVAPYLALSALLPVLGVMYNRYPERTLWSVTEATAAFSFLVLGAALASSDNSGWWKWILGAIVLEFLYAAGQAIYLSQGPGWELFTPFHQWDLSLQALYGPLVQARGTGLYFNPNELGLWAGVAVILAWTMLPPRVRGIGITLALLTLLLSESRGAAVALVAVLLVGALLAIAGGRLGPARAFKSTLTFGLAILLAVAAALLIEPSGMVFDRFAALIDVVTQGPRADANLAGRLDYWSAVIVLNAVYPFGTWGSPELLLGTAVDSSWFSAFAQGSVPYVAALGLVIVAALSVGQFRYRLALRLVAVLVAVAGLTQTTFAYPAIAVFWVLLGAGLQSAVAGRSSPPAIARGQKRTLAGQLGGQVPRDRRAARSPYDVAARQGRPSRDGPLAGETPPAR
jgi:hypothetical protein